MSQNVVVTQSRLGAVRVRAGWDSPLNELFCTVELLDGQLPAEQVPDCFYRSTYPDIATVEASLGDAGIVLPGEFLRQVERDCKYQTGNVLREFKDDAPQRSSV